MFPGENMDDYFFTQTVHEHDVHKPFGADSWRFVCVPKSTLTAIVDNPECTQSNLVTNLLYPELEIKKIWQIILTDKNKTAPDLLPENDTSHLPTKKVAADLLWVYTD
jgi:hypothetical protein